MTHACYFQKEKDSWGIKLRIILRPFLILRCPQLMMNHFTHVVANGISKLDYN
jgi:hypothetical protein